MKTYYKATRPDGLDFYSGTRGLRGSSRRTSHMSHRQDTEPVRLLHTGRAPRIRRTLFTLPWATTIGPVHPDDEQAIT